MKMLLVAIFALCYQIFNAVSTTTEFIGPRSSSLFNDLFPIFEWHYCGIRYGEIAAKNQFPYVVFLKSRNKREVRYCSGSLIQPKWVLTSAYCTLKKSKVDVILGALVPDHPDDPDRVVVESKVVFVHPGYSPDSKAPKNDVALIKLPRPVKSDAIIPINLKRDSEPIAMSKITFAGWGLGGFEKMTFTDNLVMFERPCKCKGDRFYRPDSVAGDSEFFCYITGDEFCFIHNGGGLIVDEVLVAVMSSRCFDHCGHYEGTFTNIYKHLQWIDETLKPDSISDHKVYAACSDISGFASGVYIIQPHRNVDPFKVFCELRVPDEKWTVIQQRFNESTDFQRIYADYKQGFGPLTGNHWLGLEKIHQLTMNNDHELRIELRAHNLTRAYAHYSTFRIDSEETGFRITISGYSGNAGDSLVNVDDSNKINGMKFSTFDKDQDNFQHNRYEYDHGGWWYNWETHSNLNGPYNDTPVEDHKTMYWYYNFGSAALKSTQMLIRRK